MGNLIAPNHLGFLERLRLQINVRRVIAGLLLGHWLLRGLEFLIGWVAGFVSQGITRRRPGVVIDPKSNGGQPLVVKHALKEHRTQVALTGIGKHHHDCFAGKGLLFG